MRDGSDPQVVDHKLYGSRAEFDATIDGVLGELGVELVCLAGFMRILTGTFVQKWTGTTVSLQALSQQPAAFPTEPNTV